MAQRTKGNLQQVQACRLHIAPLQHTAGNHMQQATVVANQGQLQAVDQLVGGRVGKQRLHRAQRLDAQYPFDRLIEQLFGCIAQLITQAQGQAEQ
ncbi:hypothetical protein D3C76_1240610 [compost metagenome]